MYAIGYDLNRYTSTVYRGADDPIFLFPDRHKQRLDNRIRPVKAAL